MEQFRSWIWPLIIAPFMGSFLSVVVKRSEEPLTIVAGRSRCGSCGHALGGRDLVPLISWAGSGGCCRYCGLTIGVFYPMMEIAAVGVSVWAASVFSGELLWISSALGWILLALAVIDLRSFLLPNFLTLPLAAIGMLTSLLFIRDRLPAHLIGAVAGFGFVMSLRFVYYRLRGREGMGYGDAKLLAAAGAWVTWIDLPSVILIAATAALAFALAAAQRKGTLSLRDRVPFGTFLAFGTWIVWLYGPIVPYS